MVLIPVLFCLLFSLFRISCADELTRLQNYLRVRTDHGRPSGPDYFGAADFLNDTVATLLPMATIRQLSLVPGKPITLITLQGSDPSLNSLLLNSHTDVVPVDAAAWKSGDPFTAALDRDDNRIYARGTQDMKSIGMQYLEALSVLTKNGWVPRRTVHITFVPDEEIGGFDGMGTLIKSDEWMPLRVGFCMDEGSPSPKSKYNVYVGERATWWLVVRVEDAPGHGATFPESTAIQTAHKIMSRALKYRASQRKRLEAGTPIGEVVGLNVVFMEAGYPDKNHPSGYISNMIPNVARMGFDIRVPPTFQPDDIDALTESWFKCGTEICEGVSWEWTNKVKIQSITDLEGKAWYADAFFTGLQRAGVARDELDVSIFEAATDARYVRSLGVPALGFSPIRDTPNLLHKHDEYIETDSYLRGIRVYEHLIKSLADAEGNSEPKTEL